MKRSLTLVRERLENLKIKAPIDGQVGNLMRRSDSPFPQENISARYYSGPQSTGTDRRALCGACTSGLPADFTRDGGTYKLEVTKPYPEVKEGQFRTDLASFRSGRRIYVPDKLIISTFS